MSRKFRPLSLEHLDAMPTGCATCAFWETDRALEPRCGSECDRDLLAERLSEVAREWGDCGRVAVEDGETLGFVKYAPPRYYPQAQRFGAGPPDPEAVLLACMHIRPEARQRGLGKVLLQATLRDLVSRGERTVEAFAVTGRVDYEAMPVVGVDFLIRNGFTVVKPHPTYPLMRLELKSLAVWTENLEAVLDSLRIPLGVPARVPQPFCKPGGQS